MVGRALHRPRDDRRLLRNPQAHQVPRELQLPRIRKLLGNRGLAVRGVDPRDVVRLSASAADTWLLSWRGSKIAESARRYLARVDDKGPGELAFPRADLAGGVADGDEAAIAASLAAGEDPSQLSDRPLKRPSDLRAGWMAPAAACGASSSKMDVFPRKSWSSHRLLCQHSACFCLMAMRQCPSYYRHAFLRSGPGQRPRGQRAGFPASPLVALSRRCRFHPASNLSKTEMFARAFGSYKASSN